MNHSSLLTTTFCRKCKKLRSCLETNTVSTYRFLCKECGKEEHLIGQCINCGREGIDSELLKHGGYCHLCEHDNIAYVERRYINLNQQMVYVINVLLAKTSNV